MHLKTYQIDGKFLRTGAANFSASGLKRQDNDLIVIESANVAANLKRNFDARYGGGVRPNPPTRPRRGRPGGRSRNRRNHHRFLKAVSAPATKPRPSPPRRTRHFELYA
jgi:phosphatidylserine/phosphatidylglycerophosphate/cardiolipin synthase-like enzyme